MNLVLGFIALVVISLLAFKWYLAPLFMVSAGIALMAGLTWYDVYETPLGFSVSMALIAYSLVCIAFAFQCAFMSPKESRGDEE